jgi:hypothetical protein
LSAEGVNRSIVGGDMVIIGSSGKIMADRGEGERKMRG